MKTIIKSATFSLLLVSLMSCSVGNRVAKNGANIETFAGNIAVNAYEQGGNLNATNGNIDIAHHANVEQLETLNGNITIEEFAKTGSVKTTNGNINIGENAVVKGNVGTVNGNIDIANRTQIYGSLTTATGDITLKNNVIIKGDIIFEEANFILSKLEADKPTLRIPADVTVEGNIRLNREITLQVEPSDKRRNIVQNTRAQ